MKKLIVGIVLIGVIAAGFTFMGGWTGVGVNAAGAPPTATPPAKAVKASNKVVAEGKVVPARSAALAFQAGGIVAEAPVALGDNATNGALLVRLETKQLELSLAQAEANLASAQAKLNQVKRGPTPEELAAAQQNLASAQAAYDNLMHPAASDIAVLKTDLDKAKAALDQAQAAYDRVGGDGNESAGMLPQRAALQSAWTDYTRAQTLYNAKLTPTNAQVQSALASVQSAKSALAKLQPTADDLAAAQASVNSAQAARDLAAENLKNARLVAPFAGKVTSLDVKVGEYIAAGSAVLRLADVSNWQVETTDLTELNIVHVREGDPVTVSFDAISDLQLPGKVARIKGYGENRQGDIVYTLVVTLEKQDPRLRWNMTAKVGIEPVQ